MPNYRVLPINGYQNSLVPNRYFSGTGSTDHLAIFIPDYTYNCDMPLFYYTRKVIQKAGADLFLLDFAYETNPSFAELSEAERMIWVGSDITAACDTVFSQRTYSKITVIGKSSGTLAMAYLLATDSRFRNTDTIWFSPLLKNERLRMRLRQADTTALLFIGTASNHYEPEILQQVSESVPGQFITMDGANSNLETRDNTASLKTLQEIIQAIEKFVSR